MEVKACDGEKGTLVCEIAGGEARTSQVLLRMKQKIGPNFDIITGCDLSLASERAAFMQYRKRHKPLVVAMSPICGPFSGWSRMNRKMFPETWKTKHQ